MLDDTLKAQLASYLQHLKRPIRISASLDEREASQDTRALLADIQGASPLVEVVETNDAERRPSFAIHLPDEAPRVRFAGLPLGHEFTSLVLALLHVSGHPPRVDQESLERGKALPGPLAFEVFFSQDCQSCPDVVQGLNTLAAQNPNVSVTSIDGALFREEVERHQIMSVPTIFLNGERFGQGRMEFDELVTKLDGSAAAGRVQALSSKEPFDILVVGGGPAGAAAAIYAVRKGLRTGLVTERVGGQVLDTLAIENYISVAETDGPKWVAGLEEQLAAYPIEIIKRERASRLVPGEPHALELESGGVLRGRSVILAPGARWRDMNVPGEQEYRTRGVTYCPHCDGPLFKGKRVAVIGGGNSGVEAAIDLAGVVEHVTVLEFMKELKADDVLQRKLRSMRNVEIITEARTTEVRGDGRQVVGLTYEDRATGELRQLEVAGVFVQIGLLPNTDWLKGAIELNAMGEIAVDTRGQTSLKGVFAAGDATTTPYKQIVIAAGDGAKAALGAFEHWMRTSAPD